MSSLSWINNRSSSVISGVGTSRLDRRFLAGGADSAAHESSSRDRLAGLRRGKARESGGLSLEEDGRVASGSGTSRAKDGVGASVDGADELGGAG